MSLKMKPPVCLIFLLMISGIVGNNWTVTYSQDELCAVNGSTVFMYATYTHPTDVTEIKTFWAIKPELTDLSNKAGYLGRVQYLDDEQSHSSLRLSDVKKSDEHIYYFMLKTSTEEYRGEPGIALQVTDLQVMVPAEVTEGESVVLKCQTTCTLNDPTFIWYKNSQGKTSKSDELHLRQVSSDDAGSYKCALRGFEHLTYPYQYLTLRYPPKNVSVSISPSGEIMEGSSVTLTCSSDANTPVEIYTWFMGTKSVWKGRTFTIYNITSEDSGTYRCMCSNKVGHQNSTSVTLNVLYPPKNVYISPSGEKVEGSSVTLTCSSDANPPVEIYTWFKEDESAAVGSGQSYTAVQSGQYYCKARNKLSSERSAALTATINSRSVNMYVSVGFGVLGLAALLAALLWLRWKTQKKTADEGDHQNIRLSVKDDTYAALDPASRTSDDVYHTTAISRPSPPEDTPTSSDYYNVNESFSF